MSRFIAAGMDYGTRNFPFPVRWVLQHPPEWEPDRIHAAGQGKEQEMIKNYTKTKNSVQVTFSIPPEKKAESAYLVGDFNGWDTKSLPMKRNRDGSFSITISLKPGNDYDYKYLLDGRRWETDSSSDGSHPNPFGSVNSVVKV